MRQVFAKKPDGKMENIGRLKTYDADSNCVAQARTSVLDKASFEFKSLLRMICWRSFLL
jgi:hypothetical protein